MKLPTFTLGVRPIACWLGAAALALLSFIRITRELIEGDVAPLDALILHAVDRSRTPFLTSTAMDVTALGSLTLVTLLSAIALVLLLTLRDRLGALQLAAASLGAAALTTATKDLIERLRPPDAQQLIAVSGFSYPSGHSVSTAALYLTLAIIASRHLPRRASRIALFAAVLLVLALVAASRVYLGVHYATDVISGLSLGAAWALTLAGLFSAV